MRAVAQRVIEARVSVDGITVGEIGRGLLVYVGVGRGDGAEDARWLADKVARLRIFPDAAGVMNESALDRGASALVVSQFTLHADARKGRRPSYAEAAPPEEALPLYEAFVADLRAILGRVETGRFQEHMQVSSVNEGPVTILLDSRKAF
ncbi:MAG TPA: D-aminoacyl-tRNA deacylase [Rectinemataceae bacterium]|nr:D-aminoacyl-tRNA deacylase [Rectinemataceae bacterium]